MSSGSSNSSNGSSPGDSVNLPLDDYDEESKAFVKDAEAAGAQVAEELPTTSGI